MGLLHFFIRYVLIKKELSKMLRLAGNQTILSRGICSKITIELYGVGMEGCVEILVLRVKFEEIIGKA